MANFVTVLNAGTDPVLVGDQYLYPRKRRRVLLNHFEVAVGKGLSLEIVSEDLADTKSAESEGARVVVADNQEPAANDDFTVITGIGKKRQSDLYNAGITTYEDLLTVDEGDLAKIMGVTPEQVIAWQEECYGRTNL